ncbi:chondroitin proteoglycan 2-like [Prorops nasuta]|uniref:chondroitin proteoglycan 2-like n=1 Tax=Prorops nasuta TaxID=863751 RepID=UPI0034CDBFA9
MKGTTLSVVYTIVVAVIVALAYVEATAETISECPRVNGEFVTLLPNPQDCSTYYACETGVPILMTCSPGLLFNPKLLVCDWPSEVHCEVKS